VGDVMSDKNLQDVDINELLFGVEMMKLEEQEENAMQAAEEEDKTLTKTKKKANQRRFLAHYIDTAGQIPKASRLAGINKKHHYYWMQTDPEYAEAFEKAKTQAVDELQGEIVRRGYEGYDDPIVYKGEVTGAVKKFSDNLLMFHMKRMDPAYKDNYNALGLNVGNVEIKFVPPEIEAPQTIDVTQDTTDDETASTTD